jgi:hypothetical protein
MKDHKHTTLINNKASSLVEVMVAVGIMVLVFSGLLQVFLTSSLLMEMSGNITAAVSEAQSKIDEIRGHDFDDITTDYGSGGTPGDSFTPILISGTGEIDVTTAGTGLLEVEVIINWTEKSGRSMSTTLATNVAQRT